MTSAALADVREQIRRFGSIGNIEIFGADLTTDELSNVFTELASLGITRLAVANSDMDELPEEIGTITTLQHLQLNGNKLSELPQSFGLLKNLMHLTLANNRLERFPESLRELSRLSRLSLAGNLLRQHQFDLVGSLQHLQKLDISYNRLERMPAEISNLQHLIKFTAISNQIDSLDFDWAALVQLEDVNFQDNRITSLGTSFGAAPELRKANFDGNQLVALPTDYSGCNQLRSFSARKNQLTELPRELCLLPRLQNLDLSINKITNLDPRKDASVLEPKRFTADARDMEEDGNWYSRHREVLLNLQLTDNPLPPEMLALAEMSTHQLEEYLRILRDEGTPIAEAKMLVVGEGNVGKTSLIAALRGDPFVHNRITTHGVEIRRLQLNHVSIPNLTLNAWDFGGQLEYRPTHQIYFTSSAVYVVAWKPREGPELGQVRQWLTMISQRAGADARVLIVATHGGPRDRDSVLDEEALRREFPGMIRHFFHVDSACQDKRMEGVRRALSELAADIPHVERLYPRSWLELRDDLDQYGDSSIELADYFMMAEQDGIDQAAAKSLAMNCHTQGLWIYYANEEGLGDTIILKPDWLSAAIGRVIARPEARMAGGLISHRFISKVWSVDGSVQMQHYSKDQQILFIKLMERFELSYRVPELSAEEPMSLIAQCVPTAPPDLSAWATFETRAPSFRRAVSIVDRVAKRPVTPPALMYRLIVRFYQMRFLTPNGDILHWQNGVLLRDRYGAMALLELDGNVVRVIARGVNAEMFAGRLIDDICLLVEGFWSGLRATAMVACDKDCGLAAPGTALLALDKLLLRRHRGGRDYPCPVPDCDADIDIDHLLYGTGGRGESERFIREGIDDLKTTQQTTNRMLASVSDLSRGTRTGLSQIDSVLASLRRSLEDEGSAGPRLMTLTLIKDEAPRNALIGGSVRALETVRTHYNIRVVLWCEHSYWPVHMLGGTNNSAGVYEFAVAKDWWKHAAPIAARMAKLLKPFLGFLPPIAGLELSGEDLEVIKGRAAALSSALESVSAAVEFIDRDDTRAALPSVADLTPHLKEGGVLRSLHAMISARDPGFGDLRRVVRPDGSYLWVHPRFRDTYHLSQPVIPSPKSDEGN